MAGSIREPFCAKLDLEGVLAETWEFDEIPVSYVASAVCPIESRD